MRRKPAIIAYDIVSDKRRRRVHRCLTAWRLDCQYSVFECRLTYREAEELFLQLSGYIDEQEDSLMLVWLHDTLPSRAVTSKASIGFQIPLWYAG